MAEDSRVTDGRAALESGTADYSKFSQSIRSMSKKLAIVKKGIQDLNTLISDKRKTQQSYRDRQADARVAINQYINQINQLNHSSGSDDDDDSSSKQSRINELYGRISEEQGKIASLQREIDGLEKQIGEHEKKKASAVKLGEQIAGYIQSIKSSAQNRAREVGSHVARVEGVAKSMEEQASGLSAIGKRDIFGSNMAGSQGGWRSQKAREVNELANSLRNSATQLRRLAESDDGEDEFLPGSKRSRSVER